MRREERRERRCISVVVEEKEMGKEGVIFRPTSLKTRV